MLAKSLEISDGYRLLYNGTRNKQNGLAIAVAESLRGRISLVERVSERLMAMKNHDRNKALNVITFYAPQAGCSNSEKDGLWQELSGCV